MDEKKKVLVDTDGCIGCGACIAICPKVFKFNENAKSYVIDQPKDDTERQDVQSSIDTCPVQVIYTQED